MKKIILFFGVAILSLGLFAQKSFTAKIISKENSKIFVLENSGNYFISFEINNLNSNQFEQLSQSIKSYRGVENLITSPIDKKTYFFKVEFYRFANNMRYYKDFFERNNIKNLLIEDKAVLPNELIETK